MTDETDYFGTPESRDRDARLVGHEVGPDRLGGMSFDAAIPVLTALRKSLYSEGAKRNSEVVAINTALHMIPHLLAKRDALEAENQRLREELARHDGDLDERMAALGMIPISDLLSEPPSPFCVHAGMNSIEFFAEWVARKHAEYLKMRMRYEVGKRPQDDELFEWVYAHAATFGEVHDNLRAALKGDKT